MERLTPADLLHLSGHGPGGRLSIHLAPREAHGERLLPTFM